MEIQRLSFAFAFISYCSSTAIQADPPIGRDEHGEKITRSGEAMFRMGGHEYPVRGPLRFQISALPDHSELIIFADNDLEEGRPISPTHAIHRLSYTGRIIEEKVGDVFRILMVTNDESGKELRWLFPEVLDRPLPKVGGIYTLYVDRPLGTKMSYHAGHREHPAVFTKAQWGNHLLDISIYRKLQPEVSGFTLSDFPAEIRVGYNIGGESTESPTPIDAMRADLKPVESGVVVSFALERIVRQRASIFTQALGESVNALVSFNKVTGLMNIELTIDGQTIRTTGQFDKNWVQAAGYMPRQTCKLLVGAVSAGRSNALKNPIETRDLQFRKGHIRYLFQ